MWKVDLKKSEVSEIQVQMKRCCRLNNEIECPGVCFPSVHSRTLNCQSRTLKCQCLCCLCWRNIQKAINEQHIQKAITETRFSAVYSRTQLELHIDIFATRFEDMQTVSTALRTGRHAMKEVMINSVMSGPRSGRSKRDGWLPVSSHEDTAGVVH